MKHRPILPLITGSALVVLLAVLGGQASGPAMAERLSAQAQLAIAKAGALGVTAHFTSAGGQPSRHPVLSGGERLDEAARTRAARAIAAIPGVGGVRWADGSGFAARSAEVAQPLHCQDDVDALLRTRTIRFEEASARIDAASRELVDEVATALKPCLGSIIAVTGHTDNLGQEPGNLALSQERADAVRQALIQRGIPSDGLRARGVGSSKPVGGLDPADPANRRIEFSVIATMPVTPTPVDTPGPR